MDDDSAFKDALTTIAKMSDEAKGHLRETWAADEIKAKLTRARALIGARKAAAIALADVLQSVERHTSEFEKHNAALAALDLAPEHRAALAGELTKIPADVRAVLQSGLPGQVGEVRSDTFRARIEAADRALLAAIK
jgi:hypothetical protein